MTQAEAAALEALGVAPSRLLLVGSAPELASDASGARFRERHQLGEHPIVLFLGQKYEYKGVGTLMKAADRVWADHPTARFAFLGPRTRYSRRVFVRHDPRVLELNSVSLEEKSDALAAADIMCLPSSQESFGMVFLEAWCLGKPVIGGHIPAVAELIDHGRDGLLVAPGSVPQLYDALHKLLSSAELRNTLGQNGMKKVARRYSWERCAQTLTEAYERLRTGSLRSVSEPN
jgi:glycosyltransferase involved in cell wall biosynthesis